LFGSTGSVAVPEHPAAMPRSHFERVFGKIRPGRGIYEDEGRWIRQFFIFAGNGAETSSRKGDPQ